MAAPDGKLFPARPAPVRRAVRLMRAGTVLAVPVGVVLGGVPGELAVTLMAGDTPAPGATRSAAVYLAVLVITGIAAVVALWIWMTYAVSSGREWARPVSGALFGLATLSLAPAVLMLGTITGDNLSGFRPLGLLALASLVAIVSYWAIALAVVILLARKDSGEFFRGQPGHREPSNRKAVPRGTCGPAAEQDS